MRSIITLSLCLVFLVALNYAGAWNAPTQAPPNGNVAAPVNTSANAQTKPGLLGVTELISRDGIMVATATLPTLTSMLAINGDVAASAYCDTNGQNCWDPSSMGGGQPLYADCAAQTVNVQGTNVSVPALKHAQNYRQGGVRVFDQAGNSDYIAVLFQCFDADIREVFAWEVNIPKDN